MSAFPLTLHGLSPVATSATERLLVSGGDVRLALDPTTGRNRYGCPPRPDPGLLDFASSTASVISPSAYRAADALRQRLDAEPPGRRAALASNREAARIREEFLELMGLSDVAGLGAWLSPSGTDLHARVRTAIANDDKDLTVLMPEPAETGSGVPAALGEHTLRLANPAAPGRAGELRTVAIRQPDGQPRAAKEVDEDFARASEGVLAAGRRLLLVLLDVSKTGLTAPSPSWALALAERYPEQVHLLVDACQARLAPETLRAWLENGAMLAVTGSKFLGGPSFSGMLLAPDARRPSPVRGAPAGTAHAGLLLRWEAALAELRAFSALAASEVAGCLERFGRELVSMVDLYPSLALLPGQGMERATPGVPPSWDIHPTLFPLRVAMTEVEARYLTPHEVRRVDALLGQDVSPLMQGNARGQSLARCRVHLGQPVACGNPDGTPGAALRLCISARQIVTATEQGGMARLLDQTDLALGKLSLAASLLAASGLH